MTGAFHAIFHLPLLVLTTTTYQSERNRWIDLPIVMVTLTLAGVWYGWLRFVVGKHLAGQSFSQRLQQSDGDARRHCYNDVAGDDGVRDDETAVATMIIMVLVAGYLLTRRAADFAKAEPTSPRPTATPRAAARPEGRTTHARSAACASCACIP
jgi:hypothetical protein